MINFLTNKSISKYDREIGWLKLFGEILLKTFEFEITLKEQFKKNTIHTVLFDFFLAKYFNQERTRRKQAQSPNQT